MVYSLDQTQEDIITHIKSSMAQPVYEVAIPEPDTVKRAPNGDLEPYIAFQFGDLADGYSETFAGAVSNDFWLPIYFQVVASQAALARGISNKLTKAMMGYSVDYGGQIRKRMGGGIFPLTNMDGSVSAYIVPSSFGAKIQLFDDV